MFKAFGNLLHRTPWWGLVVFGLTVLAALTLFATPLHVLRLSDSGKNPEEQRAIKREIQIAFGDSALNMAEEVVAAMKARSNDRDRTGEFDKALAEISRAREELSRAQSEAGEWARESMLEARQNALESAQSAAESALDRAVEARESLEESRNETMEKLRDKGVDTSAAARSFEEMISAAQVNERTAREALEAINRLMQDAHQPLPPTRPAVPALPGKPGVPGVPGVPGIPGVPGVPGKSGKPAQPATAATPATPAVPAIPAIPASTASAAPANAGASVGGIQIQLDDDQVRVRLPAEFRGDIRKKVASDVWRIGVGSVLILTFIPIFAVLLIAKYFIGRSRRALAFAEEKEKQAAVSDVSRQITEARLQALQAQVEPHFLYNTLANVQALTEVDPPAANQMVGHLIQYLRSALPKMRDSTSTVGQELELVRAYLNILKMRMGTRLEFSVEAPDDMLKTPFPPMMLPSLVENAIKHGLEPVREGGRIDVKVSRVIAAPGDQICIEVSDTGRGLTDVPTQSGGGVGLSNLRERLAAIYGGRASFAIESNTPSGVVATIRVPMETPTSSGQATAQPTGSAVITPAELPATPWTRVRSATSRTHSVWTRVISGLFLTMLGVLVGLLVVALLSLYTGWLPVQVGDLQLDGIEGMALGSIGLLIAFGAATLAAGVVVAVIYGLGFLFAGLLVFIPAMILISIVPPLLPFALIGLALYWFWWRKKD